jgi:hypothetical protein
LTFEITDDVVADVRKAASVVASRYPSKFLAEDVAQEIFLDISINSKGYQWASDRGKGLLFNAYKRAGFKFVMRERNRYLHFSDQYMYSSEEVKKLLAEYYRAVGDITELDEVKLDTGDVVISFLDLDSAFSTLRFSYKVVLAKRYHDDEPLTRSEQNTHSKAIKQLTQSINDAVSRRNGVAQLSHDGPKVGSRKNQNEAVDECGFNDSLSDFKNPVTDPVVEFQRLMERMH